MCILWYVAAAAKPVHPIAHLREQVTTLEAAMTLAIADAAKRPVHQLRTTTRRIEAQLALLEYLGQSPTDGDAMGKARKVLRRVRRAAGRVRDLDVHLSILERYAVVAQAAEDGSAKFDATSAKQMKQDADALHGTLQRRRLHRAEKLQRMLENRRVKLAPHLEALMGSLEPVQDLALSPTRLAESARAWFRKQEATHRIPERSEEDLHATRKAAKVARYLAESAPEIRELAEQFEAVQESGGIWHDLLTLGDTADEELGRKSPLRRLLNGEAREARDAYLAHLKRFRAERREPSGKRASKGTGSVPRAVAKPA